MARKTVIQSYPLVLAQSLSANFTSAPTMVPFLDNFAYQINVSTTDSQGAFEVEGSLDYKINPVTGHVENPGNWVMLNLSGTPNVNQANDTIGISLNQVPFNAIRLVYLSIIAGTGVADIYVEAKQLGG